MVSCWKRRSISLPPAGSKTCSEIDACVLTGVSLCVAPGAEKPKCDPSCMLALAVAHSILFNVNQAHWISEKFSNIQPVWFSFLVAHNSQHLLQLPRDFDFPFPTRKCMQGYKFCIREGLNGHSTVEVKVTLLKSVETLMRLAKTLWFYW